MPALSFLFALYLSSTYAFPGEYVISGEIKHLPDQWVMLSYMDDSLHTRLDSAYARNGHFQFNGTVTEPTGAGLFSADGNISTTFFFETGLTSITGDTAQPEQVHLEGGRSTNYYKEYTTLENALNRQNDSLKNLAFAHSSDSLTFLKYWSTYTDAVQHAAQEKEALMLQHKDAVVNAYVLLYQYIDVEKLTRGDSLLQLMGPEVQQCKYARSRAAVRYSTTLREVGKRVKNFTQPDTSGNPISTEMFSGHYFLIDFWASWCKPCRDQSPALVAAYRTYHPFGFNILSVSLDNARQNWITAIAKDSLCWPQVSELKAANTAAELYGVHALPANFLVDNKGVVIDEYIWGDRLQARLKAIFGK